MTSVIITEKYTVIIQQHCIVDRHECCHLGNTGQCIALYVCTDGDKPGQHIFAMTQFILANLFVAVAIIYTVPPLLTDPQITKIPL